MKCLFVLFFFFFFFQAEDGIRDYKVTGVQTCALPISRCEEKECEFTEMPCRSKLGKVDRKKTVALITIEVHARDVIEKLGKVGRSEEHTSELQSPCNLVCRLLLEKKKNKKYI